MTLCWGLSLLSDALVLYGLPGQQSVLASVQVCPSCPVLLVTILLVWLVALVPLRMILPLTGFLVPHLTHQNTAPGSKNNQTHLALAACQAPC